MEEVLGITEFTAIGRFFGRMGFYVVYSPLGDRPPARICDYDSSGAYP